MRTEKDALDLRGASAQIYNSGKFTHLWQNDESEWRMDRSDNGLSPRTVND